MNDALPIIYQDDDVIAVHKPAGLKVHRGFLDAHGQRYALQTIRNQAGCRVYPVHRLDQPASGLLLMAFNHEAARALAVNFRQQEVTKTYLAVVRGHIEPNGRIDSPLTSDPFAPKAGQTSKAALTTYACLANTELAFAVGRYATSRYSLAIVSPRTGRMHQIRRHFRHIHHPIIGDTAHGDGRHNCFFREHFGCHRLLLAAMELHVNHPRSGKPLKLTAPLEGSFWRVMLALGWQDALPKQWRVQ